MRVRYNFKDIHSGYQLIEVARDGGPSEWYEYARIDGCFGKRLETIHFADGTFLGVAYYRPGLNDTTDYIFEMSGRENSYYGNVMKFFAPQEGYIDAVVIAEFMHEDDPYDLDHWVMEFYHGMKNKTFYGYDFMGRITWMEKDGCTAEFVWSDDNLIMEKKYRDKNGFLSRRFQYDEQYNVSLETVECNGYEHVFSYEYDDRHREVKKSHPCGLVERKQYLGNTNNLTEFVRCVDNEILDRRCYTYDSGFLLVSEESNGVIRRILRNREAPAGKICEEVIEADGKMQRRNRFCFSRSGKLERKEIYDSDNVMRCFLAMLLMILEIFWKKQMISALELRMDMMTINFVY